MDQKFDLAIIGGGPGGYVAAIRALQLGLKVAVIEEREMGGTCLNRGCIPTKSLLHSAEIYQELLHAEEYGISSGKVQFNYGKISAKKDVVVKQLRSGVEALVKSNGGTILSGRAFIKDRKTIEIKGKDAGTIQTDKIIIASGSVPAKPPIPGIGGRNVMDSDGVLGLNECPEKVVIIGGGVIGVEFATIFSSLGKKVAVIEMMDSLIPGMDSELSISLRKSLEGKGVRIHTGSRVTALEEKDGLAVCRFSSGGNENQEEGNIIIVAIGRRPNTGDIGLENLGIQTDKGFIRVNGKMETGVPGVYAIGDITGKLQLAHVASAQGLIAAANAAGKNEAMRYETVPSCIYSSPEIASVGLSETDAIKKGYKIKTGKFPVSANGKSMIMGEKEGFAKVVTDAVTGEILGAHIMSPRATDMIAEICMAMKLESTIDELAETVHPHPTVSEIIMEAAHDVHGVCTHKMPKKS